MNKLVPSDGLKGLKDNFKYDFLSGFSVFLIALPLSIGIAIASEAPASAGLLAAIIGGIIGSLLGGSHITINGPAAGLIAVVYSSIQLLGPTPEIGFKRTLAVLVIVGILQILLGIFRAGTLALACPLAVVHGMLAAIGAIIISKQLHITLGVQPKSKEVLHLFMELPYSIQHANFKIAFIGIVAIALLIGLQITKNQYLKAIPAPLAVVIICTLLIQLFDNIDAKYFLNLPSGLIDAVALPDFSHILHLDSIRMIVTITLVASIESILSACAVERLDCYKRPTELNKELWSKGICNTLCGLLGGLPIIADIVRSSANASNGARSRWANFYHGLFILLSLALFPMLLQQIPTSCLSAILVMVGFRLAHPSEFVHAYHMGKIKFASYLVTFFTILFTDLLVGVAVGIAANWIFSLADKAHLGNKIHRKMIDLTIWLFPKH